MQKCGKRRINDSSGYFVVLPIYVVVKFKRSFSPTNRRASGPSFSDN